MSVVCTHTGLFDLAPFLPGGEPLPKPRTHLYDIAWALSTKPRYGGVTDPLWSVAHHSIMVSHRVRWLALLHAEKRVAAGAVTERAAVRWVLAAARWGLMHDAAEAFVGDLAAPLLALSACEGLRRLQQSITSEIQLQFGLDVDDAILELTHQADLEARVVEREALFSEHPARDTPGWGRAWKSIEGIAPVMAMREEIEGLLSATQWHPPTARASFLLRARELGICHRDGAAGTTEAKA